MSGSAAEAADPTLTVTFWGEIVLLARSVSLVPPLLEHLQSPLSSFSRIRRDVTFADLRHRRRRGRLRKTVQLLSLGLGLGIHLTTTVPL